MGVLENLCEQKKLLAEPTSPQGNATGNRKQPTGSVQSPGASATGHCLPMEAGRAVWSTKTMQELTGVLHGVGETNYPKAEPWSMLICRQLRQAKNITLCIQTSHWILSS